MLKLGRYPPKKSSRATLISDLPRNNCGISVRDVAMAILTCEIINERINFVSRDISANIAATLKKLGFFRSFIVCHRKNEIKNIILDSLNLKKHQPWRGDKSKFMIGIVLFFYAR